jgi:DNA-directed RNA polymerase specialized sigma24 family protein
MVILRYWREMSYIEIACTLGVTPVRVKWRLHAALNKLGCALKEELK